MAIETIPEKVCKKCGAIEWATVTTRHGKLSSRCNTCSKAYRNDRYKNDPEYRNRVLTSNKRYPASLEYFQNWRASLSTEKKKAYTKVRNEGQKRRKNTDLQFKIYLQEYFKERSRRDKNSLNIRYLKNLITRWNPIKFREVQLTSEDIQQYKFYLTFKRQLNDTNI